MGRMEKKKGRAEEKSIFQHNNQQEKKYRTDDGRRRRWRKQQFATLELRERSRVWSAGEIGDVIDVGKMEYNKGEDGIQQSTTWWRRDAVTRDETAWRQMYTKFQEMGNHQNEDQRRHFFLAQKQHQTIPTL